MNTLIEKIITYLDLDDHHLKQLYLNKEVSDFQDALGVDVIIKRILEAKHKNQKVFVGGDYDADGICATAILIDTLRLLGIQCGYYIPNRLKEGYGLQVATVEKVVEKGYDLIITVDNGVKALEAIQRCHELNIDIIVTDHHSYDEELSCPLVHSFNMGDSYKYLSGAGIALVIARLLGITKKEHVVLTGVALLADMMQVWEENRVIIKKALQYLNEGYVKALQRFKPKFGEWNDTVLTFHVIPKINATGRLSELININQMVEFLLSEDDDFINLYVDKVTKINDIRKMKSTAMTEEASVLIQDHRFPIIYSDNFHEGMVGIVAGKIVNEYRRPTIVFSKRQQILKGSARSIKGLNLVNFFDEFKHHFIQFGGHEGAAGIVMHEDKLTLLYDYVNSKEVPVFAEEYLELTLDDLTIANLLEYDALRPFGTGFKMPNFVLKNVPILSTVRLGNNNHYKLMISPDIEVLYFNCVNFPKLAVRTIKFNQISVKNERSKQKISIIAFE